MAISFGYQPRHFSDPTALPEGNHPGFLVQVTDEPKPEGWQMQTERGWRFNLAVWDTPAVVTSTPPELQSFLCSQTFSSGGKFQASRAYLSMKAALNRDIPPGERFDPNTLVPLPLLVNVERFDKQGRTVDFAIIKVVRPWPEGLALLTPEFTARLMAWWEQKAVEMEHARATMPVPAPTPAVPQMAPTPPPQAPAPAVPATPAVNW